MAGIIGKKLGMARVFDQFGNSTAVTVVEAGPCYITQIKTQDTDGYTAIQLGFEEKKEKNTPKAELGRFEKAKTKPLRILREFTTFNGLDKLNLGDEIKVDLFKEGDKVTVSGKSKGKGFQGVVKRHHFAGGPKTHGQSDRTRAPGSIGQSSYPSRVYKGLKMAGRMGNDKSTLKNRRIVKIIPEKNLMLIEGSIPGAISSIVIIKMNRVN